MLDGSKCSALLPANFTQTEIKSGINLMGQNTNYNGIAN
jgi:hypothetical protein